MMHVYLNVKKVVIMRKIQLARTQNVKKGEKRKLHKELGQ